MFNAFLEYLQQKTFLEQLLQIILPMFIGSLFVLIIRKKISQKLIKSKKHIPELVFKSFVNAFFVGAWIYITIFIAFCKIRLFFFPGGPLPKNSVDEQSTYFPLILFFFFLIRNTKSYLQRKSSFRLSLKKQTLNKIAAFLYLSLLSWLVFLIVRSFPSQFNIEDKVQKIIQDILINATLWCFILLISYAIYSANIYYVQKFQRRRQRFFYVILKSSTWPLIILLIGTTLIYTASIIFPDQQRLKDAYSYFTPSCLLLLFFKFIGSLEEQLLATSPQGKQISNKTVVQGLGNLLRIICGIIFLVIITVFITGDKNVNLTTILTGSGLGLAVAAQPIIANYYGGMVLYVEGNFKVGDWIHFTEKNIEGTIESIGARSTAIRTFEKRLLFVPNAWFSSESVVNASKMTHRRIFQKITLGWLTSLETLNNIIEDIRLVMNNHPGLDKTQILMAHFTQFAQQGFEITLYAFTKTRNLHTYRNVQENILQEVKAIIERHAGEPPSLISYRFANPSEDAMPSNNWEDNPHL